MVILAVSCLTEQLRDIAAAALAEEGKKLMIVKLLHDGEKKHDTHCARTRR